MREVLEEVSGSKETDYKRYWEIGTNYWYSYYHQPVCADNQLAREQSLYL